MSRASVRWSLDDLRGYRERLSARANNSTDLAGSVARASSTIDPVADLAVTRAALDAGYAPLVGMCRAAGLPEPVPEWVFHHVNRSSCARMRNRRKQSSRPRPSAATICGAAKKPAQRLRPGSHSGFSSDVLENHPESMQLRTETDSRKICPLCHPRKRG